MLSYTATAIARRSGAKLMPLSQPARLLSSRPLLAAARSVPTSLRPSLSSMASRSPLLLSTPLSRTRPFSVLALPCQPGQSSGGEQRSASSPFSWSTLGLSTLVLVGSTLILLPSAPAVAHAETVSVAAQPVFHDPLPPPIQLSYPESFFQRLGARLSFVFRVLFRLPVLLILWSPLVPAYLVLPSSYFFAYLKRVLEWSGPVFVKFGQWASTRPDIFSEAFVASIQSLQDSVNPHPYSYTLQLCKRTFGELGMHRFIVDEKLIGSGSMAQVHHGRVLNSDGQWTEVAVKVLHPNTPSRIETDLYLMSLGAKLIHAIPGNEFLSLPESVEQFSALLQQHNDLVHEASNMDRFRSNFKGWDNVHFSAPVWAYVSDKILVEELETGVPLRAYLRHAPASEGFTVTFPGHATIPAASSTSSLSPFYNMTSLLSTSLGPSTSELVDPPQGTAAERLVEHSHHLARLGMRMFLKMMIDDNFIHSDLHPGNLLVDVKPEYRRLHPNPPGKLTLDYLLTLPSSAIQLTVLDSALVTQLGDSNRENFLSLFGAIVEGDGRLAARLMAENARESHVVNEEEYERQMDELVKQVPELNTHKTDIGALLQKCLTIVRHNRVKIESDFASLVMSLIVVEGVGRKLDSSMSVVKESIPVLLKNPHARKILWDKCGLGMINSMTLRAAME